MFRLFVGSLFYVYSCTCDFFLLLCFIQVSGWSTTLGLLLVTYGIGVMIQIADAPNEPYCFHIHDIRLNRVLAEDAFDWLCSYTSLYS